MPFTSLKYCLFLPFVYLVFYAAGDRVRWFVLLAASLVFYGSLNAPYLLVVLAFVALATYGFGRWIFAARSPRAKCALLWTGGAVNVLILGGMKYMPFFAENAGAGVLSFGRGFHIPETWIAIGVSYYVFQAISYLFDIYLDVEEPEPHFGYFALYLAFFPKLLQGPIERAGELMPQLKAPYRFDYDNMRFGLLLFTWGFFKKVAIADRLGVYADGVYNDVHSFTGLPLLLATYTYAFQIYMDFSGYTDMALGSARLFNISLTQNFNSPYLATSVADFWRRWHISFSRWILDYIFKPLQMQWRNLKNWGTAAALVIAFLVSGIWHGTSWGFVIWGGLHGLYLACSIFYKPYQKKLHKALGMEKTMVLRVIQTVVTFHLVCFAWIFFRAGSVQDAFYVVTKLFDFSGGEQGAFFRMQNDHDMIMLVASVAVFLFFLLFLKINDGQALFRRRPIFRYALYNMLVISLFFFAKYSASKTFIYFQF